VIPSGKSAAGSAFVDNFLDTHVLANYGYAINSGYPDPLLPPPMPGVPRVLPAANLQSRLFSAFTFRPRTIGITAIYRF
jgi:hypothetical protein